MKPSAERFWSRVERTPECWIWRGAVTGNGYGSFRLDGSSVGAHRVAYRWSKGIIPADMVVDHTCRNRLCVNPEHLTLTSIVGNLLRGNTNVRRAAERDHESWGARHIERHHQELPEETIRVLMNEVLGRRG